MISFKQYCNEAYPSWERKQAATAPASPSATTFPKARPSTLTRERIPDALVWLRKTFGGDEGKMDALKYDLAKAYLQSHPEITDVYSSDLLRNKPVQQAVQRGIESDVKGTAKGLGKGFSKAWDWAKKPVIDIHQMAKEIQAGKIDTSKDMPVKQITDKEFKELTRTPEQLLSRQGKAGKAGKSI